MRLVDLNSTTTFECDWLIELSNNCLITTWQVNKWKIGVFLTSRNRGNCNIFFIREDMLYLNHKKKLHGLV